ncbi:MAG: putative phosphoribosyl transferase [Patescibacteria group bacterium]|nr:putative phosphoribosyl transferase [Patescibacteria group bacterium]
MYFKSRADAAGQLAQLIVPKYRYENCAVVALSDGGVVIASNIATQLHCVLMMLLTEQITLPGENSPVGSIDQSGGFTFNGMYSAGQLEEFESEYRNNIEQQKLEKIHSMNGLLGSGGIIDADLIRYHNVILVSDGLSSGLSLDAAASYLKPYKLEKLIVATPVASIGAVDRMHLLADEIFCLSVVENYINTNHYYEDNTLPPHETIVKTIKDIVLKWQ